MCFGYIVLSVRQNLLVLTDHVFSPKYIFHEFRALSYDARCNVTIWILVLNVFLG